MSITATELKNNLGKYLLLSAKEDVFITKNGKVVAKLTNPHQDRVEVAKSLFGILPKDAVVEKVASRKDMDYIVTRNIKDYQAGGTKIILPDAFVKLVEEE